MPILNQIQKIIPDEAMRSQENETLRVTLHEPTFNLIANSTDQAISKISSSPLVAQPTSQSIVPDVGNNSIRLDCQKTTTPTIISKE